MDSVINKFHAVRVEDLKPLRWHEIAETVDPDELIYLVSADGKRVVIEDVRVCVPPQRDECTDHYETAA